jgi:general stress protein 26
MTTQQSTTQLKSHELDTLRDKIKDIQVAMMTTQVPGGNFHTRPMAALEMDPDGTLWFFTYQDSNKVQEIEQNNHIALGFSAPGPETYVSLSARAEISQDKAKIDQLWGDFLKTWFPEGKDDPRLCLIKVNAHAGEYWDRPGGKMLLLFEVAKGYLTGQPDTSGRNEKMGDEPR